MKFTPEDFEDLWIEHDFQIAAGWWRRPEEKDLRETLKRFLAKHCNAKLKEWLDAAPAVFASNEVEPPLHTWFKMGMKSDVYLGDRKQFTKSTHSAKLVCIKEIKK